MRQHLHQEPNPFSDKEFLETVEYYVDTPSARRSAIRRSLYWWERRTFRRLLSKLEVRIGNVGLPVFVAALDLFASNLPLRSDQDTIEFLNDLSDHLAEKWEEYREPDG